MCKKQRQYTLSLFISCIISLSAFSANAASPLEIVRKRSKTKQKPMYLVPSFGMTFGWGFHSRHDDVTHHLALWGGATLYPWADYWSGFISAGVEVEQHEFESGRSATFFMPMLKVGYAWQATCWKKTAEVSYLTATFPCLTMHTLFGVRPAPPTPTRSHAIRAGIGFNFFVVTAALIQAELLVPSTFEYIIELDGDGNALQMFRMGVGF